MVKIGGMNSRDRKVEEISPPTTAMAIGERNSTSAPHPTATGTMPAPMAKVVIRIGLARLWAASMIASNREFPACSAMTM